MRTRSLIDLARNPNLIPGIHSYCDRWCERCPFTARCLVYATEQADPENRPASRDINNAAFWQKLTSILQETHEMIATWARENGVDLNQLTENEENDTCWEEATHHPLARSAEEYAHAVDQWFGQEFQQVEVFSDAAAGSDEANEAVVDIDDYLEVIRWYQFLIAVKLIRGLSSRLDEDDYLDSDECRDSDGSVKVALIAIDRSIGSWKLLREVCGEETESIQKFLLHLEQLRLRAEEEFPQARDFIRPGFDENCDTLH